MPEDHDGTSLVIDPDVVGDGAVVIGDAEERDEWEERCTKAEAELEIERMKLVACGEAALANTRDISCHVAPEYESASLQEVRNAVEREMTHRERADKAEVERDNLRGVVTALREGLMEALEHMDKV